MSPGVDAHSARVTEPTARTVQRKGSSAVDAPLTEIGTSPTPNA